MVTTTGTGTDPDQGHLQKQDCASNLDWRRPEAANSTGTGTGEQQLREWAMPKTSMGPVMDSNPRKLATYTKTQTIDDLTAAN